MKTLVTTIDDEIDVFVDDDGWFRAKKDEREFKARSLPALKKKLAAVQDAVEAMEFSSCYGELGRVFRLQVVRDSRRGRFRDAKDGKLLGKYTTFYHYDPELETELAEIKEHFDALKKRYSDAVKKARYIRWSEIKK